MSVKKSLPCQFNKRIRVDGFNKPVRVKTMTACIVTVFDWGGVCRMGLDNLIQVDGLGQLFAIDEDGCRVDFDLNEQGCFIMDLGCSLTEDENGYLIEEYWL